MMTQKRAFLPLTLMLLGLVLGTAFRVEGQEKSATAAKDTVKQEGQAPASVDDQAIATKMKALIAALDGDTLAERDQAAKEILEIGPKAIPFLAKLDQGLSGEMQARVQAITEKLKTESVQAYIKPTLVTLQGTYAVKDALAEVTKQTENKFRLDNISNASLLEKNIDLDLEDVSFWEAVDEILDASSLDVEAFGGTMNGLPLKERANTSMMRILRASYTDAFRIEANELIATRSLVDPSQNTLTIKVWVAWEPRMTPVFLQFPMKNFVLKLPDGTTLPAATVDESPEFSPREGLSQIEVEFNAKLPSRDLSKIAGVKGTMVAALPGKKVQLSFDQLDKPGKKSQQAGNLTVNLDRVRKNNAVYEVMALIRLSNANQTMDSFRGWVMKNEAYLLDKDNRRIENVGWNTTKLGRSEVGIAYLFDMSKGADQYRFIYEAAGAVNEQSFDFELPELELP